MRLILEAAQGRERGIILEDGCGVGMYLTRLARTAELAIGLEVERERAIDALALRRRTSGAVINSVGEELPFPSDNMAVSIIKSTACLFCGFAFGSGKTGPSNPDLP